MKKILSLLSLLLFVEIASANVQKVCYEVFLQVCITDPTDPQKPIRRSPIMIPKVTIEDNTLCYHQSFQGCVIQIVNDDNDIVYTNILPENTTKTNLPSYLHGRYQLQIIRGNLCFYGYINL
jgi:hypothetical protein